MLISQNNPRMSGARVESLDILRGIAIIAVIGVHVRQKFPSGLIDLDSLMAYGGYGVQLFFFISAFTMCYVWEHDQNNPNLVADFYRKRILRIAPLFWLAIPFYMIERSIFHANSSPSLEHYLLTIGFLHTFWPTSFNNVVPGGWSIGVEMTFYLFFPLLAKVMRLRASSFLVLAMLVYFLNKIFVIPTLLQTLPLMVPDLTPEQLTGFAESDFLNQAPIFLMGCFLFHRHKTGIRTSEFALLSCWIVGVLVLKTVWDVSGLFFFHCALIGLSFYFILNSQLRCGWMSRLGYRSYGIYLIHFFVLDCIYELNPGSGSVFTMLIVLAATTYISFTLANRIEGLANPFFKGLLMKPKRPACSLE